MTDPANATGSRKQEKKEKDVLESAIISFRRNIGALRIFADEIGKLVDRRDKEVVDQFTASMKALLGEAWDELREESNARTSPQSGGEVGESTSGDEEKRGTSGAGATAQLTSTLRDPAKRKALIQSVTSFTQRHPEQGVILRNSAVVTLMSHYESLVADLLHAFYRLYPAALPAAERSLTLAEILALGSIEEAKGFLIEKEVDSVLRESLKQQHAYFSQRPKVNLEHLGPFEVDIVETDQRRNIYVHNRGRVNRRYLQNVSAELVRTFGAKDGEPLLADEAYLVRAINAVLCTGIALGQLCWRKWQPKKAAEADALLIDVIYGALKDGHYAVVIALSEFATNLRLVADASRRVVVVDHAIALRKLGRETEALAILDREDWSSCQAKFHVANEILRGNRAKAVVVLRRAVRAEEISADDVREWPLFEELRTDPEFVKLFNELFPSEPPLERATERSVSEDAILLRTATVDANRESGDEEGLL